MTWVERHRLVYHSRVKKHLSAIDRKYHSLIRQTIETQLSYEPAVETKNRKPVIQPFLYDATWEIRFGPKNCFRVFYEVDGDELVVSILAIGEKQGNRLMIGGEEIAL